MNSTFAHRGRFGAYGGYAWGIPSAPMTTATTSEGAYYADQASTGGILAQTAKAAVDYLTDPVRQAAILEADLKSALARGASAAEIAKIRAKLAGARRAVAIQVETEQSQREFSSLSKVAILTGIGVGVAMIAAIVSGIGSRR